MVNEKQRVNDLFKLLVDKSKVSMPVYIEQIQDIKGQEFKIKVGANFQYYTTKEGKSVRGFYCPALNHGCDYVASKASNVHRHLKACKTIMNYKPLTEKVKAINIDDFEIEYNNQSIQVFIRALASKMTKISECDLARYNGSSECFDIEENGKRHTIYGTVGAPIPLLIEFIRTHFLITTIAWGPSALVKQYQTGEKNGSLFNDPDLKFYYYNNDLWNKLDKTEALTFLIKKMNKLFDRAFQTMEKYQTHSVFFWYLRIYGKTHPDDRDKFNCNSGPTILNAQEEKYFSRK